MLKVCIYIYVYIFFSCKGLVIIDFLFFRTWFLGEFIIYGVEGSGWLMVGFGRVMKGVRCGFFVFMLFRK